MNNEFPRMMKLLRKERHISQKQAADDLGIGQALLSHYETGSRNCSLDFLIQVADYYNVSTDYLLGRSAVSNGSQIAEKDLPENMAVEKARNVDFRNVSLVFMKKLINNSVDVVFALLARTKNITLASEVSDMLSFSVYRAFRLVHHANRKNNPDFFSVDEETVYRTIDAGCSIAEGKAMAAINKSVNDEIPEITRRDLEAEFKVEATSLMNLTMNCESKLKKLQ